jgi:ABC-type nitrate/sulfonate/bicarbonate transport system permease component
MSAPTVRRTRRGPTPGRVAMAVVPWILPVVLVVAWWFASKSNTSPFWPSLERIVDTFGTTWGPRLTSDILPSLRRLALGFGLAVVIGVGIGALLGRVRLLHEAVDPLLQYIRAVPATVLVPVSIVLFGIGDFPKIALITFVSVFPILLNTIDGVRNVEPGLEDVARSFRLTRMQRILSVQLPSAMPQIMAGMRTALQVAFVLMIITELVAATNGIGYVTLLAQASFQIPQMWSGMLLLGVLGILINGAFVLCERRILRWHLASMEN